MTLGLRIAAILVLAGATLGTAATALAESPSPPASGGPPPGGAAPISIVDTTFQPADVTIRAGETVTWTVTQAIGQPHSVTSGTPNEGQPGTVFDSGVRLRNNGDSFSWTFDTPGTYPYFCSVHPTTMTGTVTVLAAGAEGEHAGPDSSSKLIAVGVLVVALVLLLGWAGLYRRLNPVP